VGAGLGIGRSGAIVGPLIAGYMISMQWTNSQLFLAAAIPAMISAVVMFSMRWIIKPEAKVPSGEPVIAH